MVFRAVLVGCGPRGEGHANAYEATERVRLVGCCDTDAARAEDFAARREVPVFGTNLAEVLASCEPDLVDICTPASVRGPVIRAALAARPQALVVEKPLSCRPDEAREIVRMAGSTRLFVNHQLRMLPPVVRLRAQLSMIGDVRSMRLATRCSLLEQGTHLFDLASFLLDDRPVLRSVLAQAVGWEPQPPSPAQVQGVVVGDDDLRLHFECGPKAPSWPGTPNPWHQAGIEIVGTRGHASWSLNRGWTVISADGRTEELYRHEDYDDPTEAHLLDSIVEATETGTPHGCDAEIAQRSLAVINAVMASSQRGEWVDVGAPVRDRDVEQLRKRLTTTEAQRLRRLSDIAPSRILHGFSVLGVGDALVEGPRTVAEIAARTDAHEDTLFRLLRASAALDLVEEDGGHWSLRPAGSLLSSTEPANLRAQFSDNDLFAAWLNFGDTVRDGKCTYAEVFGAPFFDRLSATEDGRRRFHEHMFERAYGLYKPLVDLDVWPERGVCVDVCGGTGGLLAQLLATRPHLLGVLHDLPDVLELSPLLSKQEFEDRVTVVSSDVFESVPAGGTAYVLACVLHDWNDEDARRILAACHRAMPPDGRLLVLERVLDTTDSESLFSDLWMLVVAGGRERSLPEWDDLLASGGFHRVAAHTPPGAELGLLECVKR